MNTTMAKGTMATGARPTSSRMLRVFRVRLLVLPYEPFVVACVILVRSFGRIHQDELGIFQSRFSAVRSLHMVFVLLSRYWIQAP